MKKEGVFIAGLGASAITGIVVYQLWLNRREKKAKEFKIELERNLDPVLAAHSSSAFDVNTSIDTNHQLLTQDQAQEKAKIIYDASLNAMQITLHLLIPFYGISGGLGDDEAKIYSTLDSCRSQEQIRQVSKAYLEQYDLTLLRDLEDRLDATEMQEVMRIIHTKPEFV